MQVDIQIPEAFAFLFEPKRYKCVWGGRGSGKSHSIGRALLLLGMQSERRIVCAREIQKNIDDSVHKLLSDLIYQHGLESVYEIQKAKIVSKINRTEFMFIGLRHNPSGLKSLEGADILWVEEAENISKQSWEIVFPTIRKQNSEIWVSFNPKNLSDPTYQYFVANADEDCISRKVYYYDNPFFPETLEKERIKLERHDPEAYAHVWMGEPDTRRNGVVYAKQLQKAMEEGRITSVPPAGGGVFTAWDLGYADSTAIWWLQWVGRELRWLDYYENNGEQLSHYAQIVLNRNYDYGKTMAYLPHDGGHNNIRGESVTAQLTSMGIRNVVLARENDITAGIDLLRETIGFSAFDKEKCKDGLWALEHYGYEWDENRMTFKDKPKHDWTSHCFVGSSKVLTRQGIIAIKDLPFNGEVFTLCGWKPYQNPRVTRKNAQLVEVVFKGGYSVKCTPEHLFLTEKGWKSAEHLETGLLIRSSLTHYRNTLMAPYTAFTNRLTGILRGVADICTAMCGRMPSEKYRKDAISTTKTGIDLIIKLRTLSVWTLKSTCPLLGKSMGKVGDFLKKRVKVPQLGTNLKKGDYGTKERQKDLKCGLNGSANRSRAYIAVKNLWRSFVSRASINFATLTAKPLIIEKIRNIPITENDDVWCLTVPDVEHFSLSNGAIVHNCADSARYAAIAAKQELSSITQVISAAPRFVRPRSPWAR